MALLEDPEYLKLVKIYSEDQAALDKAFSHGETFFGILLIMIMLFIF